MTDEQRYYGCQDAEAVAWLDLDGLTLIYHRRSGMTHIVDSPVPEILRALPKAPVTPQALLERLADTYDLDDVAEATDDLLCHLDQLAALGLVRVG